MGFRQPASIVEAGQYVGLRQLWIAIEDVLDGVARAQEAQDRVDRDSGPADDRPTVADIRVQFDAVHGKEEEVEEWETGENWKSERLGRKARGEGLGARGGKIGRRGKLGRVGD
jgi:hypothetical protein